MAYLQEFKAQIQNKNLAKILVLWEEYVTNDRVDAEEFLAILTLFLQSDFREALGPYAENGLPLLSLVDDQNLAYRILEKIVDLETTNSPSLKEEILKILEHKYGQETSFQNFLRLVGLRGSENFQGAISHFELLNHMKEGNFVYHTRGWGTGEIMEVSWLREHVHIEFENVSGIKDFSFANAFKTLTPLPKEHFLARRFGDPDALEAEAEKNPIAVICSLLRDLGPMTVGEIKDALCGLVIPEERWSKWWYAARNRLRKNPLIETPSSPHSPFVLRNSEITEEELIDRQLQGKEGLSEKIGAIYTILRDHPHAFKNHPERQALVAQELIAAFPEAPLSQRLQITLLLESLDQLQENISLQKLLESGENLSDMLHEIEILALRKRILHAIQTTRSDWPHLFLHHLLQTKQVFIKEYLFQELVMTEYRELLEKEIENLVQNPRKNPETFIWYFQKIFDKPDTSLPYSQAEGKCRLFESFLVLYSQIEGISEYRDLVKKMYTLLTENRFALVRKVLKESDFSFAKEFLLLVAKCQSLSRHDIKILYSLAEVAHPSLKRFENTELSLKAHENYLWTTEEAYLQTQNKIQHLGTVEVVENAKEIEAARSLGDLRENSEYKFALEKRARLQNDLRRLSQQFQRARILTKDDVPTDKVDVGTVVELANRQGNRLRYTILGPWDADVDQNILSFQSKLAEAMLGCRKGESFEFKDEVFEVVHISSFFDQ